MKADLNELLNIIVNTYFNMSCLMYYYNSNEDIVHFQQLDVVIQNQDVFRFRNYTNYCKHILIQTSSPSTAIIDVEQAIESDKKILYYNLRKYLIIIDDEQEFSNFFRVNLLKFIKDVLVVFASRQNLDDEKIELYTHKYTGLSNNTDPIYLDTWYCQNYTFKYGNNLYPDKTSNQLGRKLICYQLNGGVAETNIVRRYAEEYNLTLIHTTNEYDDIEAYGTAPDSKFFNGLDTIDMYDSFTINLFRFEVSVPSPRIKYDIFAFLGVFPTSVMVLIILTLFVCGCIVKLREKYLNPGDFDMLEIFGYIVNQPVVITPDIKSSSLLKYIIILILILNIVLVTAFNSRMSSIMVVPEYENDIKSLAEFAKTDLKLLLFDKAVDANRFRLRVIDHNGDIGLTLADKMIVLLDIPNYDYKEILSNRKYGVLRLRLYGGGYYDLKMYMEAMIGKFKTIQPNLMQYYYYILLRKNSVHTLEISKIRERAIEGGLVKFWGDENTRLKDDTLFQAKLQDAPPKDSVNLNFKHLRGVFLILCISLFSGLIILLIECKYDNIGR